MAFEYQSYASLGLNLNRQKYGPLDVSNVFTSENDLRYYLSKGAYTEGVSEYWTKITPYPYEGQVLATVINGIVEVFVLALDAEGNFETREIAGKIEVDGTTIVKDADGKLSIVAPVDPDSSKSYNFTYANGVYSWVAVDTATAAGQAQAIEGLTTRTANLEAGLAEEVSAREAADTELVGKIAEALQAAKDYADANDANTIYDDTAVKGRLDVIESDYLKAADKYNDSELRAAVAELDTAIGDASNGLVKDVADNKQAIADEKARAEAAEKALDDKIKAIDFVDSTELAAAIAGFATTGYVDGEISRVEAAIAELNHFKTEIVDGVNKVTELGVLYLIKDDSVEGVDKYNEYIVVDNAPVLIGDTTTDLSNYYDKTGIDSIVETINGAIEDETDAREALAERVGALETADNELAADIAEVAGNLETANVTIAGKVDSTTFESFKTSNESAIATAKSEAVEAARIAEEAKGYAVATDVENTYLSKAAFAEHEAGIANDLLAYAKTEDVNAKLDKKIESGSIAHSSETLAEGVTVDGTKLNIVVDAYTKEETLAKIDEKITSFTGGESAADVLSALNTYKETNNNRVGQIEAKNAEQDEAISAAQTQADKGVADAKKVSDDLVTANGLIANNTREIETVKGSITTVNETLSGEIANLKSKDIELAGQISGLTAAANNNSAAIGEHAGKISALENKDTELVGLINAVDGKFASYYDKDSVDAKVKTVSDAINAIDLDPYATTEAVNSAIGTVNAAIAERALATSVYTKEEANAEFMTQDEVDARINALIAASDPESDGNTITNIQNLVEYVENNAGEIAALITTVGNHTTTLGEHAQKFNEIDAAIAELNDRKVPQASTEISVADDGTLGINEMNVNKLVQTTGDTLVLNGGNAGVVAAE